MRPRSLLRLFLPPFLHLAAWTLVATLPVAHAASFARYRLDSGTPRDSQVTEFRWTWTLSESGTNAARWVQLEATKANAERYRVWMRFRGEWPASLAEARARAERYVVEAEGRPPVDYRHGGTGGAVLPSLGGWTALWPREETATGEVRLVDPAPPRVQYLGQTYARAEVGAHDFPEPPTEARVMTLRPDLWVGVPSNQKTRDSRRRYDGSEYEMIRLTEADYQEMAEAGLTCVRVDAEQRRWVRELPMFYWGLGGSDVPFPESLYDSQYLGPALFLDEPAVHARDFVIRPQLSKDLAYRVAITPRHALRAFEETFRHAWQEGGANELLKGFRARADIDLGTLQFRQANLYSWETMVSTAAHQLTQDPDVPAAIVFEPPGRVGTWRTLPEMNMTYGCQIPVDDPRNLTAILYGFLRGAARLSGKEWGTSIYGAVDRADAPWFLTRAYDLGATRFFFWDNYQLACVPRDEYLALARQLRQRAENHPARDLERLRDAAEVAILLPPGYNLGHVHLGRGNLWGVTELNLERVNERGVKHREVMSRFFLEIERCLRLGVEFDLLWDLPEHPPRGYREVVRIRDDGKVEVRTAGRARSEVFSQARKAERPEGAPPKLAVTLSTTRGVAPLVVSAEARVEETSAPVYYTHGTDPAGVCHNAVVAWELYGPHDEDQRQLAPPALRPTVRQAGRVHTATMEFTVSQPGRYRLRAATVDRAGRSTVEWIPIEVAEK